MSLEGKVAVLTGGEGAFGRAVTKKFLDEGAKLVIAWYTPEEWEEAKGLIPSQYRGQFIDVHFDATKEEQVENLMKKARDAFGSIDILMHMVGQPPARELVWETDTAIFDQMLEVNLKSAFLCCKHAVRVMLEKGRGRIVVFPSRVAIELQPRFGAYAISKAGLITLTLALREELKDTNITVNAVVPDRTITFRTARMSRPEAERRVKPSEVADLLGWLCADECDLLSGSTLKIFGKV